MTTLTATYTSPIGPIVIESDGQAITSLRFSNEQASAVSAAEEKASKEAATAIPIIAETIHSAIGKAQENRGRQLSSKEIKTIGLVALIVIGTAATVTAVVLCVKNAKEKKSKETLTAAKIVEMHQARTAVCRKNEA